MRRLSIATFVLALLTSNATAGDRFDFPRLRSLFERKKKDDDTPVRAKQLLVTLKSDKDEKKRRAAAEGLSEYDPRGISDLMSGLIASLRQDPAISVRAAAAETIGKLKPANAQAGVALEEAVQADPSDSVRKAAQDALFQYHLNGYKASPWQTVQTAEPPLAGKRGKTPAAAPTARVRPPAAVPITVGRRSTSYVQSPEPPLAKPITPPAPVSSAPSAATAPTVVPPSPVGIPGVPAVAPLPIPMPMNGIPGIPIPGKPNG